MPLQIVQPTFICLVFSIYLVLSYGFDYFCTPDFNLIYLSPSMTKKVGEKVKLMCRTDKYWEWCR